MIYIDRSSVPPPEILLSKKVEFGKENLISFYTHKVKQKERNYAFERSIYQADKVRLALKKLFHKKCAYCESKVYSRTKDIVDHFRPEENAMNLDGTVNADHYWWLTYEWDNLYLICNSCNRSKSTRFPVKGRRIKYMENIHKEEPLLVNPCVENDFIIRQFGYDRSGGIFGLTEKAKITIDIFNLNREELIYARKLKITELDQSLDDVFSGDRINTTFDSAKAFIKDLIDPSSEYSDQSNFILRQEIEILGKTKGNRPHINLLEAVLNDQVSIETEKRSYSFTEFEQEEFKKKFTSYNIDLKTKTDKTEYFTTAKRIKRIEIENFKIIKTLKLEFPKPKTNEEPWMVLLGENGSGKSSVMQAIALTLVGARRANELGLKASHFANRNSRARNGFVKIEMEGIEKTLELHFSKDSDKFESNSNESKVVMLAFGSTRLMANEDDENSEDNLTNLKNLFNPYATLPNIKNWVADPKEVRVREFDQIAIELKKMLQLPEDNLVYRRKNKEGKHELYIKINSAKKGIALSELSSGYQSIIVLTLNIIKTVMHTWKSFSIAEGIVLIDEIGVHLHPKWKLQIIRTLRDIFPAMTFIITTHEPLCLRGVNEGEVVLMKFNEENEVIALTELPSPKGLTVEQLISSKFFGLITSFDPEVELQLNSYYLLKSKLERNPTEQYQLEEIENELGKYQILDKTKDEILKEEMLKPDINIGWISSPSQQEDLKQSIKSIWDETI